MYPGSFLSFFSFLYNRKIKWLARASGTFVKKKKKKRKEEKKRATIIAPWAIEGVALIRVNLYISAFYLNKYCLLSQRL